MRINKRDETAAAASRRGVSFISGGKRMLGPIPAARARKRAETLFAIATLHLRNRQHCGVRGSGEINGDRYDTTGTRDATVTEETPIALLRRIV